eukprot:s2607_g1.t1
MREIDPDIPPTRLQSLIQVLAASHFLQEVDFNRVEALTLPNTSTFDHPFFQHCQTQLRAPDCSGQRRASSASSRSQWATPDVNRDCQIPVGTASSRSQWATPDLNRECQIPVGTAGLHPRAPDLSGQRRTSYASSRSQWAPPDLNRECQMPVGTAGLWATPDFIRELQIPVGTAGLEPRVPDASGHCRTSSASSRFQWALPDLRMMEHAWHPEIEEKWRPQWNETRERESTITEKDNYKGTR